MTDQQEELLRLLDLGDEGDNTEDLDIQSFDFECEDFDEVSESVLKLDDWDLAKGEHLKSLHLLDIDPVAVADFHSAAYHIDPEPAGRCVSKRRQQFMDSLLSSPEFAALRETTRQNPLASEMATVEIGREFAALLEKDKKNSPSSDGQDGVDGPLLAATARAIKQAQEEADAVEEMQQALGDAAGMGQGTSQDSVGLDKIRSTFQRMKSSQRLKEIFERAGAYRRAAKAIQQSKSKHGYDDMVGVELGGDVDRLLANELAVLMDEDLELDTLRRIVERQAMCREYEGIDQKSLGPVVVVVDESGSMNGPKIANAKALALAMAWIAKRQKRWCALVGFSGGTEGVRCVLKPGKWNETELLEWLDHFYGGGTTLDVPLEQLPNKYWTEMQAPKGKTDVIIVTDAIVRAPKDMVDKFNTWKKDERVRCITLVLESKPGDLAKVSDEVHCIPSLTVDCDAAASCMSI